LRLYEKKTFVLEISFYFSGEKRRNGTPCADSN